MAEDDIMKTNEEKSEEISPNEAITEKEAMQELKEGNAKAAVVTGSDLDSIEIEDLQKVVREYDEFVFARITPRQKIKILESFKRNGEIVALTGDSSQDAEAMHKADISIGMGLHGCDASRDAADVILTGDSFGSIVSAIEEGRTIYDNLQKAMVYVFSSNVPAILPFFIMGLLEIPFPMGAGFIFLINLIAEIFPVLFLAQEGSNKYIFSKGRIGHRNFFCRRVFEKAFFQVGIIGVLSSMLVYFVIFAENGFMPTRIIAIDSTQWNSPAINDVVDSFNQEWSYSSRKHLEYTCQTAFFLSIIILQIFNFGIIRTRVYQGCYCSWQFLASIVVLMGYQVAIILILMYSFPEFHVYLHPHLYPLKFLGNLTMEKPFPEQPMKCLDNTITDWLWCLPFPFLLLILEEIRRFIIRHSEKDSWLQREIF